MQETGDLTQADAGGTWIGNLLLGMEKLEGAFRHVLVTVAVDQRVSEFLWYPIKSDVVSEHASLMDLVLLRKQSLRGFCRT